MNTDPGPRTTYPTPPAGQARSGRSEQRWPSWLASVHTYFERHSELGPALAPPNRVRAPDEHILIGPDGKRHLHE
jgi:hypothetical protein